MKYKTTKRDVMRGYVSLVQLGYCELQEILNNFAPVAYTTGIYGWNADIFDFGPVAIVTGYRPFGRRPKYEKIEDAKRFYKEGLEKIKDLPGSEYYSAKEEIAKAAIRLLVEGD